MRLNPKTDEEFAKEGSGPRELLRDGTYDFDVHEATEGVSSTGNDMITVTLNVYDQHGVARKIYDYLVDGAMGWKVRHCAEACGLLSRYEAGHLDADDLVGKQGRVKIGRESARGDYAAKNRVVDYVADKSARPPSQAAPAGAKSAPAARQAARDIDDEIPF
jgi:hypothetical protein